MAKDAARKYRAISKTLIDTREKSDNMFWVHPSLFTTDGNESPKLELRLDDSLPELNHHH